jgi:DNA polymerase V
MSFDASSTSPPVVCNYSARPGEVWGVGPRWARWLEAQEIVTALDLKQADPKAIRRNMTVVGERLVHELNSGPCLPLELVEPPRQGLTVSRSFGQILTALQPITDALVSFVGRGKAQASAADGGAGDGLHHDEPVLVQATVLRQ